MTQLTMFFLLAKRPSLCHCHLLLTTTCPIPTRGDLLLDTGGSSRSLGGVTTPKTWSLKRLSWGGLGFCCPGLAPTLGVTDGLRGLGDPQTTRNRFFFWNELGPLCQDNFGRKRQQIREKHWRQAWDVWGSGPLPTGTDKEKILKSPT